MADGKKEPGIYALTGPLQPKSTPKPRKTVKGPEFFLAFLGFPPNFLPP
jgi:hypothetical protein